MVNPFLQNDCNAWGFGDGVGEFVIFSEANLTDKFAKNRETPSTQYQSVMELWGLARIRAPPRIACKGLRWAC